MTINSNIFFAPLHFFSGLVPSRLFQFCLLPFRLLNIKLCTDFTYSAKNVFFDTKTNIPATELAFSTTRGEGMLFPLCSSPKSEDIHTWAAFIHFIHQTIAPVFVPLWFVQLAWEQPRLQFLICPELMSFVTHFEGTLVVGNTSCQTELKANPNVYKLIENFINRNKHTQC